MDDQASQKAPSAVPPAETPLPNYRSPIIFRVIILMFLLGIGGVYLFAKSQNVSKILPLSPTSGFTNEPTDSPLTTNPITNNVDKTVIQSEIIDTVDPKMTIELIDISPIDNALVAYLAHNEPWNKEGVYFFNRGTKKSTPIYEKNEEIVGRGGYDMDNEALEFSPSGEAFFVNRTGINFPPFFIINAKGEILYQSDIDIGHATWVSGQKLVYLSSSEKPQLYDINAHQSEISQLPDKIFHLKANGSGTKILAYSLSKNQLQCASYDLHIYSYPSGAELKFISNTTLGGQWSDDHVVTYQKVIGCKKNIGEAMFEYSPATESQKISAE